MRGEGVQNALNDTGSLRRLCTLTDRPGAYFVGATGEVSDELKMTRNLIIISLKMNMK
jgi:hypothetical protein